MYRRKWKPQTPDTEVFHGLLANERTRPTMLKLWDQLFEADWECQRVEEHYLAEVKKLQDRVDSLEKRFLKDPLNSHKPPSSEPFKKSKKTRSLREKSGKPVGGQPGHAGRTVQHRPDPDETRVHPVYRCGRCGHRLKALPATSHEVRQVIDLKDGKTFVIEHRSEMKICPKCDSMNHGGFPTEARAYVCYGPELKRVALYFACYQLIPNQRTREILKHLYGLSVSGGSLFRWIIDAGKALKPWENHAKAAIIAAPVAGFDETGLRAEGALQWLHVSSTEDQTLLSPHEKRGSVAWNEIGILPDFKGTAVHDGFTAYWNYKDIDHALCNAHHLRELTFVHELEEESWALEMKKLLQRTLHHLHRLERARKTPRAAWIRGVERNYDKVLKKAYRAYGHSMPAHPPPPRSGAHEKRDTGHALLRRLHFYKRETLAFLRNPAVPFTNNQAERDFRMAKVKQKISGCFRSWGGALAFFRIRSFLSTKTKQGIDPYLALLELFLIPASAVCR